MAPLRTTVIGSYPFPGWLEHAAGLLDAFGPDDIAELQEDAVIAAVHDQVAAGLDVISDGEQTRLDFNLGFYGHLEGIEEGDSPRRLGPPAHDQRPKHRVVGELAAPLGLGTDEELERLRAACDERLAAALEHYERVIGDTVPDKLPMPLEVHRRQGEPCPRCGTRIEAVHFKDYVMCYCPEEQTGGRVLKDRRLSRLLR